MSDFLPVKHVYDPDTGEILGTIREGDTVAEELLIEDRSWKTRAARAAEQIASPRMDPRELAQISQARAALAMPAGAMLAAGAELDDVLSQHLSRAIAAGSRPEAHPPVEVGYRFCETCGAAPGRCSCNLIP